MTLRKLRTIIISSTNMKRIDIIKKLKQAGYKLDRDNGNHSIYEKDGCRPVQVPRHKEINENTAKQILKDAGLL